MEQNQLFSNGRLEHGEDQDFLESLTNSEQMPFMDQTVMPQAESIQGTESSYSTPAFSSSQTWQSGILHMKDEHGKKVPCYLADNKQFVRVREIDMRSNVTADTVRNLQSMMVDSWDLTEPSMIVNIIGDIDHSHYAPQCLKRAIKSLFHMTKNTWILTEGYDTVFNNIVGRGVRELQDECNSVKNEEWNVKVTSVGISTFSSLIKAQEIVNESDYDIAMLKSESPCLQSDSMRDSALGNKYVLNENNTHFIMAEGPAGSGTHLRKQFFYSFDVPRANLVVGGGRKTLAFLDESIKKGIPCILVEGSGGLADELAPLLRMTQDVNNKASEREIQPLVKQFLSRQQSYTDDLMNCWRRKDLFVLCSSTSFRKEPIQQLLLDAYMKMTPDNPYHVLELSHSWNCLKQGTQALASIQEDETLVSHFLVFLEAGSTRFVDLVLSHKPAITKLLQKTDFIQLYQSDKIAFSFVQKFLDSQQNVNGLYELAGQIKHLLTEDTKTKQEVDEIFHLFIWSIFYKKYDLARYLWSICDYPVANGILASSVLRSLIASRNTHRESNQWREEQAVWFETKSSELLSKCNDRSQLRTKVLLLQNMKKRGNLSCLQIVTNDDDNNFFLENPVCIRHLDDLWTRCRESGWQLWLTDRLNCFVLTVFFIALLFTFWTESSVVMQLSVALAVIFLALFFVLTYYSTLWKFARYKYGDLRAVVQSEEGLDLDLVKIISKNQCNQFLECGVGMDMYYEENEKRNNKRNPVRETKTCLDTLKHCCINFFMYLDTPEIKFILHVFSFSFFLFNFLYLILSAPPDFPRVAPSGAEIFLYLYCSAYFFYEMKQLCEGEKLRRSKEETLTWKLKEYMASWWNRFDSFLGVYFIAMILFRCSVLHSATLQATKYSFVSVLNFYTFYFILWCLRTLQIFVVSHNLGPKLIMIRLMISDLSKLLTYIALFTFAYGVWLKAIKRTLVPGFLDQKGNKTYLPLQAPVDMFFDISHSEIVYFFDDLLSHPLWHLFGESFIDELDKYLPPQNGTMDHLDLYKVRIIKLAIPFVRIIYVLITVVLLLNLVIAVFQFSIDKIQSQADKNWNIYRKSIIFEYHNRAILPAPLSLPFDIFTIVFYIFNRCSGQKRKIPSIIKRSDDINISMLNLKICNENLRIKLLDFVRKWEKLIQKKHLCQEYDHNENQNETAMSQHEVANQNDPLKFIQLGEISRLRKVSESILRKSTADSRNPPSIPDGDETCLSFQSFDFPPAAPNP